MSTQFKLKSLPPICPAAGPVYPKYHHNQLTHQEIHSLERLRETLTVKGQTSKHLDSLRSHSNHHSHHL